MFFKLRPVTFGSKISSKYRLKKIGIGVSVIGLFWWKKHVSVSALKNPYQSIHKGGDDDDDDDEDEDDEDDNDVFYSTFLHTDIIFIDIIYIPIWYLTEY